MFFSTHRRKLRKLQSAYGCILRKADEELRLASKAGKSGMEIENIRSQWASEVGIASDAIDELLSSRWLTLAQQHDIPLPPSERESQFWEKTYFGSGERLSAAGREFVREKYRSEMTFWTNFLVPILSLAVAILAIVLHR